MRKTRFCIIAFFLIIFNSLTVLAESEIWFYSHGMIHVITFLLGLLAICAGFRTRVSGVFGKGFKIIYLGIIVLALTHFVEIFWETLHLIEVTEKTAELIEHGFYGVGMIIIAYAFYTISNSVIKINKGLPTKARNNKIK